MAAQDLLEGARQLARRARISGLVALCAVELCFLWVSIKSDVKVQRCYFYYSYLMTRRHVCIIHYCCLHFLVLNMISHVCFASRLGSSDR